tara:strand:+ start:709 stop:3867 length:3159 start_codon:yes stop_codon:yes gene_type:complete
MAATIQQIVKPTRARGLDTSGNNNHAQIYSGRGLEFDGVTDYLSVTGAAAGKTFIDYSAETTAVNRAWTVAVWLNYDAAGSSNQMISGYDNSVDVSTSNYLRLSNTEKLGFYDIGGGVSRTGDTVLKPKTWYRAVFVYNGSDTVNFYLNGVADGSGTLTSSDANNNADLNISHIGGALQSSVFTNPFAGKMSDFQAWQGAWTSDDVEYDYLNPEQLVLNRGGTSLTNSNLKLWYPMNEGHRGNQSYVLDASNTGLGNELINNTDFESNIDNWAVAYTGGDGSGATLSRNTTSPISGTADLKLVNSAGENAGVASNAISFVSGYTYKVSIDARTPDGNLQVKIGNSQRPDAGAVGGSTNQTISTTSTSTNLTYYFTSTETETNYIIFYISTGRTFYIDNVSIKTINAKNNATTVFYGDEQITEQVNRDFSGSGNWSNYGSSSTAPSISGGKLVCVTDGDGGNEGAQLALGRVDGAGSAYPIVAGRTYRMSAKLDNTAGKTNPDINFALGNSHVNVTATDGSPSDGTIDTTEQEYYADITAADNSTAVLIYQASADNDASTTFTIDDVSIKEIGVAMGWTDADQQLDIPQTVLQSYTEIPYNFTKSGSSSTSHFYTCDASVGTVVNNSFTLSMWLFSHDEDSGTQFLFAVNDRDAGYNTEEGFAVKWLTNGNLQLSYQINSGGDVHSTTGQIFDSNDLGKWFHFAISHNYSNDTTSIYKNGELITTKDHSTTMDLNIGGGTTQVDVHWGDASAFKGANLKGAMNEMSVWNTNLSASQIDEIYNSGIPLDCTTHSASSNLTNYWRNNGLAVWSDLAGSNNLTPTNFTETMLITAGVDSSRDSQGFFMNRQRTTNTLNLPIINIAGNTYTIGSSEIEIPNPSLTYSDTGFSVECWFKAAIKDEPMFFISHQEGGNDAEGFHFRWAGANTIYAVISDGTNQAKAQIGGALNVDQWYHIVASWDHSNKKKYVYIDGILRQVETESSMGTIAPNADIHIGTRRGEADQDFIGQIDDVKLYNRILTDGGVTTGQSDGNSLSVAAKGEVLRNYNAGKRSHK